MDTKRIKETKDTMLIYILEIVNNIISYYKKYMPLTSYNIIKDTLDSHYKRLENTFENNNDIDFLKKLCTFNSKRIKRFKRELLKHFKLYSRLITMQFICILSFIILSIPVGLINDAGFLITILVVSIVLIAISFTYKTFKKIVYKNILYYDLCKFCETYFDEKI